LETKCEKEDIKVDKEEYEDGKKYYSAWSKAQAVKTK
jgi:hypothetical protein